MRKKIPGLKLVYFLKLFLFNFFM